LKQVKKLNEGVLLKQAKKLNQGVIYFLDCHEGVLLKQAKKLKFVSVFLLEEKKIYTYRVYVIGMYLISFLNVDNLVIYMILNVSQCKIYFISFLFIYVFISLCVCAMFGQNVKGKDKDC
jgi:hypothetical protein